MTKASPLGLVQIAGKGEQKSNVKHAVECGLRGRNCGLLEIHLGSLKTSNIRNSLCTYLSKIQFRIKPVTDVGSVKSCRSIRQVTNKQTKVVIASVKMAGECEQLCVFHHMMSGLTSLIKTKLFLIVYPIPNNKAVFESNGHLRCSINKGNDCAERSDQASIDNMRRGRLVKGRRQRGRVRGAPIRENNRSDSFFFSFFSFFPFISSGDFLSF